MSSQVPLFDVVPDTGLSQWFTPEPFAQRLWKWAMRFVTADRFSVLEPSAGLGTLCKPALESARVEHVTACEVDARWLPYLEALRWRSCVCGHALEPEHQCPGSECSQCPCGAFYSKLKIVNANFLDADRWSASYFGLAFMNPPYEDGADVEHLSLAAQLSDVVVALMHARVFWSNARAGFWERHKLLALGVCKRSETYPEAKSDFVAIALKRSRDRVELPQHVTFEHF